MNKNARKKLNKLIIKKEGDKGNEEPQGDKYRYEGNTTEHAPVNHHS
jgi:hypothetical protein